LDRNLSPRSDVAMQGLNLAAESNEMVSTQMFKEAGEAHARVRHQLTANAATVARIAERLQGEPHRAVVTCGRGSSDHAATFAKYLIETRLGVLTSSAALSVSSVYKTAQNLDGVLYLAISQSGKSPDLLASVEAAKAAGAFTIALVNDAASPLAKLADEVIPLHAGPELSVAATKSYITALTAIAQLVAHWSADEALVAALNLLPDLLAEAWRMDWTPALASLQDARNLFVLGRGLGFGVAQEAALKLKETCGLHAEAFSSAEVEHGPMALVQAGFPLIVFAQNDETHASVKAVAERFVQRGADVWLASGGETGPGLLPSIAAHPALEPILMIQSFYRLANAVSVSRGYNPDTPPHLNKVTETV
jgi:glucosamine--fructose-6-phosphate aminotransferase (isomerizing)